MPQAAIISRGDCRLTNLPAGMLTLAVHADPARVDALIVTGGLGHYIGRDGLQQFCAHYHPLPVVSLEILVEGVPSIVPDFYSGMYALVRHLVEDHGHRRIAFIRGLC